jgi:hypothetical protein
MSQMSASAQQSLAVAVDTATAEPAPAPAVAQVAPAQATQAAPVVRACWRLTTAGYLLLLLATAFAWFIPHLHLHAKVGEEALVLLDMTALLVATALIVAGYLRSLLRQV